MTKRFDTRTALIIIGLTILGAVWAYYNYGATGGRRDESVLRALVWTVFATPFASFIGWLIARPREGWLAAYVCFCIYFFTTFVAARIESFFYDATAAEVAGHPIYFSGVIIINIIAAVGAAVWRARTPYAPPKALDDDGLANAPEASAS